MDDAAELAAKADRDTGRRGIVLLALCLGVLVAQVDTSVVILAMQPIREAFRASVAALQWVLDAYNFVYAVLLLSGGLLADLYGRRRAFRTGAAILTVASIVCAFAPTVGVLIAARALAGVGGALLVPASLAIVRVVWSEPAARRRALGIWAGCNGLAFAIGPTLGGLLIERFGWPSVFFLVVPLSVAAFVLAGLAVEESSDPGERRFDPAGQMSSAFALGGIVLAVIAGRDDARVWAGSFAVSVLAFGMFLRIERRIGAAALVPLDLFRRPAFCGAIIATAAMTFGIYGMIFLLPMTWQSTGILEPQAAGVALMPCALVFFVISQRSGHLAQRVGVRAMVAGGTCLIGCGLLVLAATNAGRPIALAEIGLAFTGAGMGLNTGPLMSVAVEAVSAGRSGTASSLINVARMAGATLGVAVLGTVFAMWHGGAAGLRAAMIAGGTVQLCGAMIAWTTIR